ncbi:MAG: hypothetical protein JO077_11800 [Verrucomicrobia bacterium]|nr:hypothetical protein [Verrucomicrobiota bacterium]
MIDGEAGYSASHSSMTDYELVVLSPQRPSRRLSEVPGQNPSFARLTNPARGEKHIDICRSH